MSQNTKVNQPSFFDNMFYFGADLTRHLENSWAGEFRKHSLPILIEAQKDFATLYSDKLNTRPSTPTFLVLGYMVLKSLFVLTDEDLILRVRTDAAIQYALGTLGQSSQSINELTLSRFRTALTLYEQETNIDLIKGLFEKVSEELKKIYLGTSLMCRVDSIMISGGCRHLSRLQLAHTVNRNALFTLKKADADMEIPEGLEHYLNEFDENQVTYHSDKSQDEKLFTAFQDGVQIEQLFPEELKTTEDHACLTRFIDEQIVLDETGSFQAIRDGKTLTSTTMYNPADPEGTIRKKAGETHFGYVGCFAETVDQNTNRKIIDSCDFKPNIHSDTKFCAEELDRMHENGDTNILVGDGG